MSNLNVNNLTSLAGNNGTIGVSSSLNVSGSITLTGNVTANGNIVLGDSTGDSVSLGAEISSSIIPDANVMYNLGSSEKQWKEVHARTGSFETLHVNRTGTPQLSNIANLEISRGQENDKAPFLQGAYRISAAYPAVGRYGVHISTASFTDVVSSSLMPAVDDAFDLGRLDRQWKDLYLDGVAKLENIDFGNNISLNRDGNKGVSLEGALSVTKAITASNVRFASMSTTNHPQNLSAFSTGDLYFMSGSQIFTGSAFQPGHADQIFTSPSFSSSIFVFKK